MFARVALLLSMTMINTDNQYSGVYSTRTYYLQTDTFGRPIKFSLLTNNHSAKRAIEALQAALYPVKVIHVVEPFDGLDFMDLPGTFDECGRRVKWESVPGSKTRP